ncbi:MAG TPA: prolyl oligopeptidase family serine peptidase, partial [Candidatus Methylacidiphilales bacterium]|nr:prolyl oligopeptidase family serine peptidase [Candidatus Methylacidiphilales bacterium]
MLIAPIAEKIPHITTIHDIQLEDNYRWLQDPKDQKVLDYLTAENAYAEAWFEGSQELQDKLNDEIISYINEDYEEVPYKFGTYLYGTRTKKGLQYPIFYRIKDEVETIYLDLNILAEGEKFFNIGQHTVSPDETMLAYTTDTVGFRQYKLYIKNLETGAVTGPIAENTGSVVWAADNRTLLYTIEDSAKRDYRVYRHVLGQTRDGDALIFEESDERFSVGVGESLDRSMLFVETSSHTTSEYYFVPSATPAADLSIIFPRQQDIQYDPELHGEDFVIRINDKGNNFRLIRTPIDKPELETAEELVPHRDDVSLSRHSVLKTYCVLFERANALQRLSILPLNGEASYLVDFPEPTYSLYGAANYIYSARTYRYSYGSLVSPQGTYELDLKSGKSTLLKERTPPGPYEKSNYQSERIFATSLDGTKIPISLIYRKDLFKKGKNPLHLLGYGSYGISMPSSFSAARVPLLDRGFIAAIAHIRGGGEYGKSWHDAGK